MNHPSDDKLLELTLELLDEHESRVAREHLGQCADCRERCERIRENTELLGRISPDINAPSLPAQRARTINIRPLLKAAALLVVGFFGGFTAAAIMNEPPVNVVPSCLVTSSPPDSIARYPVSDATAPSFILR